MVTKRKFGRNLPTYLIILMLLAGTWLAKPIPAAACTIEMEIALFQNHWYTETYEIDSGSLPASLQIEAVSQDAHAKQSIRLINTGSDDWFVFQSNLRERVRSEAMEAVASQSGAADSRIQRLLLMPTGDAQSPEEPERLELVDLDQQMRNLNVETDELQPDSLPNLPDATALITLTNGVELIEVPVVVRYQKNVDFDPRPLKILKPPHPAFISSIEQLVEHYEYSAVVRPKVDDAGQFIESDVGSNIYEVEVEKWLQGSGPAEIVMGEFGYVDGCLPELEDATEIMFFDYEDGVYTVSWLDGWTRNSIRNYTIALEQEILDLTGQDVFIPPTSTPAPPQTPTPGPTAEATLEPTSSSSQIAQTPSQSSLTDERQVELAQQMQTLIRSYVLMIVGITVGAAMLAGLIVFFFLRKVLK